MTIQEYILHTRATIKNPIVQNPWYLALGLGGEAGEVLNEIKKLYRDKDDAEARRKVKEEMGDLLWYLVRLCDELDFDILEILDMNVKKLKERYGK